jgi:hypothetical protein
VRYIPGDPFRVALHIFEFRGKTPEISVKIIEVIFV